MTERTRAVKRVSVFGFLANLFLLIAKFAIGFMTGSQAMIADGFNSAGDVFASIMTYLGNYISSQPDDIDHPYGHGKAEYVFSFIISFSFLFVSYFILKSGIESLIQVRSVEYSIGLVIVAGITILMKIYLYLFSKKVGKKYHSLLAVANSEDHRNDLFITSLTFLSIICSYFQLTYVDAVVGILIAIWIAFTGIRIFLASYNVLMDQTLDLTIVAEIKSAILQVEGVDHLDTVVALPIGPKFLILTKVSVDGNLSVTEGHDIAVAVKALIMQYDEVSDVMVHINPAQTHPQRNYLK